MVSPSRGLAALSALLLATSALAAPPKPAASSSSQASSRFFCCDDESGHRICGDTLPPQCQQKSYREIGRSGAIKDVGPPMTSEQKAQRQAEAVRQKELAAQMAEQRRRDQALLASYGSEKDIDTKRDKIAAEAEKSLKQAQAQYDEVLKRKEHLAQEMEFYLKKPVPAQLKSQVRDNEAELAAQQKVLETRKQEIESVRSRFEEEKRRYLELTRGRSPAGADTRPR